MTNLIKLDVELLLAIKADYVRLGSEHGRYVYNETGFLFRQFDYWQVKH